MADDNAAEGAKKEAAAPATASAPKPTLFIILAVVNILVVLSLIHI